MGSQRKTPGRDNPERKTDGGTDERQSTHTAIHKGEGKRGESLGETEADRPVVRQGWDTRAVPWLVWMPHCHEWGERGTALWNLLPRRFLWFLVT